ncbi:MAG: MaoC family dehydratase N-terminal domain-containing protein [Pseudomonadota bacterium]
MTDDTDWVGRSVERRDVIRAWPAQALHATLDLPGEPPQDGDPLPPFWRWMYFLEARPRSALGRDGHPAKGYGVSPPIELPRRMWAGGRLQFHRPVPLGAEAVLRSTIASIAPKTGRSGRLAFVTIRHELLVGGALAEVEEQDIVYREDPVPDAPKPEGRMAPATEQWRAEWTADPTVLFRYSALTFNGHRIHYDEAYAREVEGYDGLVVHGPLLATLMVQLVRERAPDQRITRFAFRALSPIVHSERFSACGAPTQDGAQLWIAGSDGRLAMSGDVSFG